MRIVVKELKKNYNGFKLDTACPVFDSAPGYRVIGNLDNLSIHCHLYNKLENCNQELSKNSPESFPYGQNSDSQSNIRFSQTASQWSQEDLVTVREII